MNTKKQEKKSIRKRERKRGENSEYNKANGGYDDERHPESPRYGLSTPPGTKGPGIL